MHALEWGKGHDVQDHGEEGMTLRDYFAAHAVQGLLANPNLREDFSIAKMAYTIADNMLKVRAP